MENNNYEQMTVPMLKNLARERGLRGYSRLRKAELIQRLRASRAQILDHGKHTIFNTNTTHSPTSNTSTLFKCC